MSRPPYPLVGWANEARVHKKKKKKKGHVLGIAFLGPFGRRHGGKGRTISTPPALPGCFFCRNQDTTLSTQERIIVYSCGDDRFIPPAVYPERPACVGAFWRARSVPCYGTTGSSGGISPRMLLEEDERVKHVSPKTPQASLRLGGPGPNRGSPVEHDTALAESQLNSLRCSAAYV